MMYEEYECLYDYTFYAVVYAFNKCKHNTYYCIYIDDHVREIEQAIESLKIKYAKNERKFIISVN